MKSLIISAVTALTLAACAGGNGGGTDGVAVGTGAARVRRVEDHVDLAFFDEIGRAHV
mgnify:CR=1 FL=1